MSKNIFSELSASRGYLTRVERLLADFILNDPQRFLSLTMSGLSKAAGVSQGSINNFARKFSSGGFSHLKSKVSAALSSHTEPPPSKSGVHSIKDVMYQKLDAAQTIFSSTLGLNDEAVLARAVRRILCSRRIDIYGTYHSGISARDLCFQLIGLGIPANFVEDTFMCAVSASTLDENALVIAISASGRTSEIIDAAQIAKENHAGVVCLTTNPFSPLAKISDDVLLSAHDQNEGPGVGYVRMSQLFVIDSIITYLQTILQQDDPANRDRLRRFNISHSIMD